MEPAPFLKLLFWLTILVATTYYFIVWPIYVLKQRRAIKASGQKTIADIIGYNTYQEPDGHTIDCPVLKFTTGGGKEVILETKHENGRMLK